MQMAHSSQLPALPAWLPDLPFPLCRSMKGKDVMRKWVGQDGIKAVELDERADGGEVQDALLEITVGDVDGWGGSLV
jgi:hypothetical protein